MDMLQIAYHKQLVAAISPDDIYHLLAILAS